MYFFYLTVQVVEENRADELQSEEIMRRDEDYTSNAKHAPSEAVKQEVQAAEKTRDEAFVTKT